MYPRFRVSGRLFYDGEQACLFAQHHAVVTGQKITVMQQNDGYSHPFVLLTFDMMGKQV